jgi:hypothetical protein
MHKDHAAFVQGIHAMKKLRLIFFSKEDNSRLERMCAPMDFGASRRAKSNLSSRYHFWDFDSDTESHTLSLLPEQVISMGLGDDGFDPADFVTWDTKAKPWFIARNWGEYS